MTSITWQWASSATSDGTFATISGATNAAYTPVSDDVGNYLRASASYTDDHGGSKTASAVTANAVVAAPVSNSAPVFGPDTATRSIAENTAAEQNIGEAVTATDADDDALTYSLGGADMASFNIVAASGQLQTKAALDYETKSSYEVTVTATDPSSETASITVTISVTNADEAGAVSFSSTAPQVGTALTATPTDPDGGVTSITWQWASSATSDGTFTAISGATNAAYTPVSDDVGNYLKATASYEDTQGTGKTASAVTAKAVALRLSLKPGAPSITEVKGANEKIKVSWTWGDDNGCANNRTVNIQYAEKRQDFFNDGKGPVDKYVGSVSEASHTFTGVEVGNYFVRMFQFGATADAVSCGSSPESNIESVTVRAVGTNAAPEFPSSETGVRSVAENTVAGESIGAAVTATDDDDDILTYSLGGIDAASFAIVAASGQLQTKVALNHETKTSYEVRVTATDPSIATGSIFVTIRVTDVTEAPDPPVAPTVTAVSRTSLSVSWSAPTNTGPAITDYDVWYREKDATPAATWIDLGHTGTDKTATITGLDEGTAYEVQVRATNAEGMSVWSASGTGTTVANVAPVIDGDDPLTISVAENRTGAIGTFTATDANAGDSITWSREGADASSFTISGGVVSVASGTTLDYESDKTSYSLTVKASDGVAADTVTVTVNVTDVEEAGTVSIDSTSPMLNAKLTASLSDPDGGEINIAWQWSSSSTSDGTFTAISGATNAAYTPASTDVGNYLKAAASYEDARSTGKTASAVTATAVTRSNRAPVIDNDDPIAISIDEDITAHTLIGSTITASDADDDPITWSREGPDAALFQVVQGNLATAIDATFDYETTSSYTFKVKACDPVPACDTITVNISITNRDEAGLLSFNSTSPQTGTALIASLTDPDGGEINIAWQWARSTDGTTAWSDISDATSISYTPVADDVGNYLRASASYTDDHGDSKTASAVSDNTVVAAPVSNNAPEFDTETATRSIAENTVAEESIGAAVTATDADGDSLTYSLGGADMASFGIVAASGQLQTKAALNYETKSSYTVTVTATDQSSATDSITVTISVTDVAEAPVISGDDTVTIEVAENTTGVIRTFRAMDADAGDTITWTVEGTDKSSFTISGGVVSVASGTSLDYESAKKSYSITVKASDGALSDTVTVTVDVTNVDEDGTVSFDSTSPAVGTALTASLSDPDGGVTDRTWQWSSSATSNGTFTDISGATNFAYTPVADDVGNYLRASASYTDDHGDSKTASAVSDNAVVAAPVSNNAPEFDTETASRSIAENTAAEQNIGAAVTATDADGDTLTYSLGGTDVASFGIVAASGQLQTKAALNYETKSSYTVTVTATDQSSATDSITVTINVTNLDEAGSVSFSLTTPITGKDITAELTDPDGGVTGAKWQWAESSSSSGPFTDIIGVGAQYPTITILTVFKGNYLRATVSYTDAEGTGKTASAVTVKAVETLSILKPRAPTITEVKGANEKIKVSWTWGDDNGCANNRTVNIQYAEKRQDFFNDGKGPVDKYVGSVTGASHTFTGVEVGNYFVRMFQFGATADDISCGSSPESNIESVTVRAVGANAAPEFPSSETGGALSGGETLSRARASVLRSLRRTMTMTY